jgi:uncharacterized membrane protein
MTKLSEAKTLGGIGSILVLLFIVPSVGWVLALVGFILMLIAIKYVSDAVADPSIFRNMIISVVLAVAGLIVGVVVILASVVNFFGLTAFSGGFASMPPITPTTGGIVGLVVGLVAGLAVIWILLTVSAIFARMSYNSMASKLGVSMFRTAGLLYLIGAATIIILVGFLILFEAIILSIVAFFSVPDQLPPMVSAPTQTWSQPPSPPPAATQM